jgi:hypothetical protein
MSDLTITFFPDLSGQIPAFTDQLKQTDPGGSSFSQNFLICFLETPACANLTGKPLVTTRRIFSFADDLFQQF